MAIRHILRDGTVLNDITGHVVKMEDAQVVYAILDKIHERKERENVKKSGDQGMA